MAQPTISWWKQNNIDAFSSWQIGTVDAGNVSENTTFLIWNNRGGTSDIPDAEDCKITTKDLSGNNTGELVTQTWIRVRVDTMNELNFTEIGGDIARSIKAGGGAPAGVIKGTKNDGTVANAAANFAQVTANALPKANATAGNVDFLLRVFYTYR